MLYPIEVARVMLEYSDGRKSNKFYELFFVQTSDGRSAVIRRYGKIGAFGDVVESIHQSILAGEKEFEKLLKQKTGKGYQSKKNTTEIAQDASGLRALFGPALWPKLSAKMVAHLDPSVNTSTRAPEAPPPRFDEDGNFTPPPPKVHSPEEIAAARARQQEERERQAEIERAEAAQEYRKMPGFGRF
jgi:predicted DNA-binding WGR domain protein